MVEKMFRNSVSGIDIRVVMVVSISEVGRWLLIICVIGILLISDMLGLFESRLFSQCV